MEPFIIRRATVAALGDRFLLAFFDAAARRMGGTDLVYPNGWESWNTRALLSMSPRAFWLLARAELIPVSESDALKMILREGRTIERPRAPVAKVHRFNIEDSITLMRIRASQSRKSRPASPQPASPRTFTI